jgi:hypothetical protein
MPKRQNLYSLSLIVHLIVEVIAHTPHQYASKVLDSWMTYGFPGSRQQRDQPESPFQVFLECLRRLGSIGEPPIRSFADLSFRMR